MKQDLFKINKAGIEDIPLIFDFIKRLAEYEKLSDAVTATEETLTESLFGKKSYAECILGYYNEVPVGFAVFFHNFSTFLGKQGLYLEDLFVLPEMRGKGYGRKIFEYIANLAVERDCGRLEWSVLNWNEPAINFYKRLGSVALDDWTVYRLTGDKLETFTNKSAE